MEQKKYWDITKGIRICRFRRTHPYKRNLRKTPYCLEVKREANLIVRYEDLPNFLTGRQFLSWIKARIKEEFGGDVGRYWVGGKYGGVYSEHRHLFNCPVLMVYYDGAELRVSRKYSYRQKSGIGKSTKKLYHGIRKWRELNRMSV